MRKEAWSQVALYIAKTTHAFVEGGKKTITIPYLLSKLDAATYLVGYAGKTHCIALICI
jgi:hypothetical protein